MDTPDPFREVELGAEAGGQVLEQLSYARREQRLVALDRAWRERAVPDLAALGVSRGLHYAEERAGRTRGLRDLIASSHPSAGGAHQHKVHIRSPLRHMLRAPSTTGIAAGSRKMRWFGPVRTTSP
jgi:hypothetical protein